MSYVALYRAYRPKKFSEVYGQKVIVQTLQNALKHQKVAHAYLFSGPRGTGKTSIAKLVAKTLNCLNAPTEEPCENCHICQSANRGEIPDIIEIDAASNNGVDEIRDLRDKVKYTPSVAKYKVYIIDEVHMLTTGAFNALLKTLEEPPKQVIFILATTEIHKVPATIISRCQRFDFKNLELPDLIGALNNIVKQESIDITDEAIRAIAINSEGGARDAIGLLDQAVSFTDKTITEEDIFIVTGGLSRHFISKLLKAIYQKQTQIVLEIINQVLNDGKDITRVINDLILALRDILLDKINEEKKYPENQEISSQLVYVYLDILNQLQQDIKWTTQKRAYLELGLIQMINHQTVLNANLEDKIEDLEKTIKQLEAKMNEQPVVHPIVEINHPNVNLEPLVTISQVEEVLNNGLREKKKNLLKAWYSLSDYPDPNLKLIAKMLSKGSLEAVSDNKMLIVFDDQITAEAILSSEVKPKVLQIFNSKNQIIDDYYAIIKADWILIKEEYAAKYNAGYQKPRLEERNLHLFKPPKTIKKNLKDDESVKLAYEYFGENKVKVEE